MLLNVIKQCYPHKDMYYTVQYILIVYVVLLQGDPYASSAMPDASAKIA